MTTCLEASTPVPGGTGACDLYACVQGRMLYGACSGDGERTLIAAGDAVAASSLMAPAPQQLRPGTVGDGSTAVLHRAREAWPANLAANVPMAAQHSSGRVMSEPKTEATWRLLAPGRCARCAASAVLHAARCRARLAAPAQFIFNVRFDDTGHGGSEAHSVKCNRCR